MWNFIQKIVDALSGSTSKPVEPEETFQIINITDQLPWHPTRKWAKRGLVQIKKVVVHQAYSSYKKTTLRGINKYHITPGADNHLSPNGAPHIAYHYGIIVDGTVYQTNYLSNSTWHTAGHNTNSIGVLVLGDFHGPKKIGSDKHPTRKQLLSLERLLNYLVNDSQLGVTVKDMYGHTNFGKENCPGNAIMRFLEEYKRSA